MNEKNTARNHKVRDTNLHYAGNLDSQRNFTESVKILLGIGNQSVKDYLCRIDALRAIGESWEYK